MTLFSNWRYSSIVQPDCTVRSIERARERRPWLGVINVWFWWFRRVGGVSPDRTAYDALVDPKFNPRPVTKPVRQAAQCLGAATHTERSNGVTCPFLML